MMKKLNMFKAKALLATKSRPVYEPPRITTYTDDQLLDVLGPAQATLSQCELGPGTFCGGFNNFVIEEEQEDFFRE